ncbi:hypothetical protein [Vallitalea guaymasensis]|uniref:hypothetical protein n=1 Tax=Vallitalea guaymasensis TaxID=1185412 RepID=UPI000DE273DE|nr:hypothetical protein [Vallitalea guaymasensis]
MKNYSKFKKLLLLIVLILFIIAIIYSFVIKKPKYDYLFKGNNNNWTAELYITKIPENEISMVTNFTYKKSLTNLLDKKIILRIKTPYDTTIMTYNYSELNDIPKEFTSTSISKNSANMLINGSSSIKASIEIEGLLEEFPLEQLNTK